MMEERGRDFSCGEWIRDMQIHLVSVQVCDGMIGREG